MGSCKKAEINSHIQQAAIGDSDDLFKHFQENLNELKSADPSIVPEDVNTESIVSLAHSFPVHPFSTPWKHQKPVRFSDVFRG